MWATIEPVLSWLCIIALGLWLLWAGMIKPVVHPNPTTTQTGGISYTVNVSPFSCARIPSAQEQTAKAIKPVTDKVASAVKAVVK